MNFRLLILLPLAIFAVIPAKAEQPNPTAARFTLIDAEKDIPLGELRDGVLNLEELPTKKLNVEVQFDRQPQAVIFRLNSSRRYRQETAAPYAMAGNNGKDFHAWTPKPGKTKIEAVPQHGGKEGTAAVLHLEIISAPGPDRSTALVKPASVPQAQVRARLKNPARETSPIKEASLRKEKETAQRKEAALPTQAALPEDNILFELNGEQTVPPSGSAAKGKCVAIIDSGKEQLNVVCTHTVADPIVARLYEGTRGSAGQEMCDLGPPASPVVRSCPLSAELLAALKEGRLYVQIDSPQHPSGAVRGQLR